MPKTSSKLKVILILFLIFLGLCSSKVFAATTYKVSDTVTAVLDNNVLTVSGNGDMPDFKYTYSPEWYGKPITKIVINSGITKIGKNSFVNIKTLKEIVLPNTIKEIGEAAFHGAAGLTSFTAPSSLEKIGSGALAECTGINKITLNEGLKKVDSYAFQNTAITSLSIPSTVENLGVEFTYGCNKIEKYICNSNKTYFTDSNGVLYNNYYEGLTDIIAFPPASKLESYNIKDGIDAIRQGAFKGAKNLKSITVPKSVTNIAAYAFAESGITDIVIPELKLSVFTCNMFENCKDLKSVTIKADFSNLFWSALSYALPSYTFSGCSNLKTVNLESDTIKIIEYNCFKDCTSLENIKWPKNITKVSKRAFEGCTLIKEKYPAEFEENGDYYKLPDDKIKITGTYNYDYANEVLRLVNEQRRANGLTEYVMTKELQETANQRAAELALYFSHDRANDTDCFEIFPNGWTSVGENIALGQPSPSSVMNSWMHSQGHKENILSNRTYIGISCFEYKGSLHWVQCFMSGGNMTTKAFSGKETKQVTIPVSRNYMTYTINKTSTFITNDQTDTLSIDAKYVNKYSDFKCDNETFNWISSNTNVATVTNGVIKGISEGKATISVKMGTRVIATCEVTVKEKIPFNDVPLNSWFYEAVKYNYKNNIIKGYQDGTFKPGNNITRGQLVTILWRMENEPKINSDIPFSDVNLDAYYLDAIKWAAQKKIVNGYDDGTFRPDTQITRQQLAVMLCNFARYKGKNVESDKSIDNFKDGGNVAGYALSSIKWAIENKVMSGKDQGTKIDPIGTASRCECAAMIYNYCTNIK